MWGVGSQGSSLKMKGEVEEAHIWGWGRHTQPELQLLKGTASVLGTETTQLL